MIFRKTLISTVLTCALGSSLAFPASAKKPLTVGDAIETTRVMEILDRFGPNIWKAREVLESPDKSRYAAMLVHGDVARDGVWMDLISGGLTSLGAAKSVRYVGKYFARARGPAALTFRFDYHFAWLPDSARVAFTTEDASGHAQVTVANVLTGETRTLTNTPNGVELFDVASNGSILFASALPPSRSEADALIKRGFAVSDNTARGLISGFPNGSARLAYNIFLADANDVSKVLPVDLGPDTAEHQIRPQILRFSPDGQHALVDVSPSPAGIPDGWGRYTDPILSRFAREAHEASGGRSWVLQRIYLIDVSKRQARPLWGGAKPSTVNYVAWSPDSTRVLLGPTFLPPDDPDPTGQAGNAVAVVNVDTGHYQAIPVPGRFGAGFHAVGWASDSEIHLANDSWVLTFQQRGGQWRIHESRKAQQPEETAPRISVTVDEDIDKPPRLMATDTRTGKRELVLDLNPRLTDEFSLGRAITYKWKDRADRDWSGRLYYPVNYQEGKRYPVVIQTHGVAADHQYSLFGIGDPNKIFPGLGPPGASSAQAQVLANHGFIVLQVQDKSQADSKSFVLSPQEPRVYAAAYEAAAESLDQAGLAIRSKIGLSGFSRSGWYVEYALTHTAFPYAAAAVSDNFDAGYLQACINGTENGLTQEYADDNGAPGVGAGMQVWLQNAPPFSADRIQSPLRMQIESGGLTNVVGAWEMFNALRVLGKPVELYVVPEVDLGAHNLQNPRQIMASAEGTVDWFDFWLNDHEDPNPEKSDQYARWRRLRDQRQSSSVTSSAQAPR